MRLILAALTLFATQASADEMWATAHGNAIYETEIGNAAVFTVPEAGRTLRVYLPGLAGNYDNRSTHSGYWLSDGPGLCPASILAPDGAQSRDWGRVTLAFDGPAFPTSWTMLVGDCFGEPQRAVRGTSTAE